MKLSSKTDNLNHLSDIGASLGGFKTIMKRGRCFGLRGRVYRAVVLEVSETDGWVKWTFCNGMPPAVDAYKDLYQFCDWLGDVDEGFAQKCEAELKKFSGTKTEGRAVR